ncbi:unnamed protein product [Notodromas monacha]|uniref:Tetraspanin n=1 Tax=Notodromas monacha TaxID=399045 RepID=A0A7R9BXG9_9CRUS|nr:unnamed protein product [Notodromas monacha]CAG0923521.1 unnamed protein product [Notodromas monacha]
MVLNGVMFILTLAGAAYTLDHGIEYSKLSPWLKTRLLQLVDGYEHNTRDRRIMDMIQEFIGCCGSISAGDYDNIGREIPDTCRHPVTGNDYVDGCYEVFAWYLETKSGWIAGVALFLCLFQIVAMVSSWILARGIIIDMQRSGYYE